MCGFSDLLPLTSGLSQGPCPCLIPSRISQGFFSFNFLLKCPSNVIEALGLCIEYNMTGQMSEHFKCIYILSVPFPHTYEGEQKLSVAGGPSQAMGCAMRLGLVKTMTRGCQRPFHID